MFFRLSSGLALQYRTRGIGRPVLLLHPVGLRGAFWAPVMAELEADVRLIVPDARGHGDSDVPQAPFSLEDMADDMIELLRCVGGGKAVVVGCSMGGMVAQAVALRAPDLVAGLVVANTSHTRTPEGRAVMERRAAAAAPGMPGVVDSTLSRWFSAEVHLRQPEIVLLARNWLLEADPIVHAWSWRAIRDLAHDDRLGEVRVPALCIAGSDDQSTATSAIRATAQAFGDGRFRELPATGHLAPLERPAAFAALLREFIADLRPI